MVVDEQRYSGEDPDNSCYHKGMLTEVHQEKSTQNSHKYNTAEARNKN